ncbi:MAG: hypothetical protein A3E88_04455 [Legionellales bacterium RIFCSPHIGHO2_12_FULL_35_11]|nr:MAG: hypothetical protein A3E88_04455 [Legionellales bacterium RIFCSPHIGHO2_12_FULL_35_11]
MVSPILVNIIGAGKMGKTIGKLLVQTTAARILAVHNRTQVSSIEAINFIGDGAYYSHLSELPPATITIIGTPDDHIASICHQLNNHAHLMPKSIVMHLSGALTSDVLEPVKKQNCYILSAHPMCSFAIPALAVNQYPGTYCAIEGDATAVKTISELFQLFGSLTCKIHKDKKALYHASGVFAANYLVTIAEYALQCLNLVQDNSETNIAIIINLMRKVITNLETTSSPAQALTGPIQRGDLETIKKHLTILPNATQKRLYAELSLATLPLTSLTEIQKTQIQHWLLKYMNIN